MLSNESLGYCPISHHSIVSANDFSDYYVLRKIELVVWFQIECGAGHRVLLYW